MCIYNLVYYIYISKGFLFLELFLRLSGRSEEVLSNPYTPFMPDALLNIAHNELFSNCIVIIALNTCFPQLFKQCYIMPKPFVYAPLSHFCACFIAVYHSLVVPISATISLLAAVPPSLGSSEALNVPVLLCSLLTPGKLYA